VEVALRATGIADFFIGIVTSDDVNYNKPAPDAYLRCLERYGLCCAECLAVEDTMSGLIAARGAGLDVVVVNNTALGSRVVQSYPTLADFAVFLARELSEAV
jgi:beta-phosphoglucomutase-like phosphatase (HAD superfamily)